MNTGLAGKHAGHFAIMAPTNGYSTPDVLPWLQQINILTMAPTKDYSTHNVTTWTSKCYGSTNSLDDNAYLDSLTCGLKGTLFFLASGLQFLKANYMNKRKKNSLQI